VHGLPGGPLLPQGMWLLPGGYQHSCATWRSTPPSGVCRCLACRRQQQIHLRPSLVGFHALQVMVQEFLAQQKRVERTLEQARKVDRKIAEYDVFRCETELMLQQLREVETGFTRQRQELSRGSVHVLLSRR
jgi:hypothetical protein